MKKYLFIVMGLLLVGCSSGETVEVACTIDGKEANFTLKNGMIYKYSLNGNNISKSTIDEINGEYFTSSTNNEEGKETLQRYVEGINGKCE